MSNRPNHRPKTKIKSKPSARVAVAASIALLSGHQAFAQTFTPGNLVVSRSTYVGVAGSVTFPGSLPNNAASVADGTFPNVFNNETPDGAFGITSPIFLDNVTMSGTVVNSLNVTNAVSTQLGMNLSTSFPSKSELGLSLTPDGTAVTFMAYGAAINQLDVSNSNTPGHVDITNGVNGQSVLIAQRDIAQVNLFGTVQVTTTNGYSGNNGRNVVLGANGNYYTVGNAGNNGSSASFSSGTVAYSGTNVTLSGASTTANMYVGTPFSGTGVPAGAYVTSITDSTHFTISAPATGSPSGSYIANEGGFQLTGVSFNNTSTTVTVADTSKLVPGMPFSTSGGNNTGLVNNSYIASITDSTHFVVSTTPSGSSTGASYIATVSNSMLSDNTGVRMIQKGQNDTTGTGTGILDAVNNSVVVGTVNGTYGTTPGYQRGFSVVQLPATTGTGTTGNSSTSITGVSNATLASLSIGEVVTGLNIPSGDTIKTITPATNTIVLNTATTSSGGGSATLTFTPAADKSGKDDNFRGIANYNNTLYVSKGSGGNGLDAVYQVNPNGGAYVAPGTSAGLATTSNAATASINPLPGWPTSSTGANESKNTLATVYHPFGIWFANDTTLYVGDEGAAGVTNAAPGGLEKWTWDTGTAKWILDYTLAAGTIASYPGGTGLLQAGGLRNITGEVNGDGTVTVFGITSTTGNTLNDEGADPNQLVAITDTLSATSLPAESFTVLETAASGDVLRGVALAPTPEPGSAVLLGTGVLGLLGLRRRRNA